MVVLPASPARLGAQRAPRLADHERELRTREDQRLFRLWLGHGDRRARAALIERFLPLARSLAGRYHRSGEPLEDLIQVASAALVKAIDRYDRGRGCAFTSFAVPTIRLRTISPRAREMLRLRFEDDLTQAEIGALFGVSQMQVSRILREVIARLRCVAEHRRRGGG